MPYAGDTVIGLLILKPIYQIDIAVKRALGAKLGTLKEKSTGDVKCHQTR
jgi:hypothetical protein